MIRPYNIQTGAAPFDSLHIADLGDVAINTFSLSDTIRIITETYAAHLKHDFIPMTLGGDHTLTLPVLRAVVACTISMMSLALSSALVAKKAWPS